MTHLRTILSRRNQQARARRSFARALDRAITPASREELLYLTSR